MKLVSTPGLDHKYQVVRADGLPDVPLTLFANDLLKSLSPSSVPIYMREVLAAFDWAQSDDIVLRNRWSLLGTPAEVRSVLREYLIIAAKCTMAARADRLGVKETYVCQTSETGINIRILLAGSGAFTTTSSRATPTGTQIRCSRNKWIGSEQICAMATVKRCEPPKDEIRCRP